MVLNRGGGLQRALVDGAAGIVWAPGERLRGVLGLTITDGKIREIHLVADPESIRKLDIVLLEE